MKTVLLPGEFFCNLIKTILKKKAFYIYRYIYYLMLEDESPLLPLKIGNKAYIFSFALLVNIVL